MLDADPQFRPLRSRDGYLRLEDIGLIGDGTTAALVGLDGSIPWLCLPRFDSEPLLCSLLDRARGGYFTVAPEGAVQARQRYQPDTAVLTTELRSPSGSVAITDALALRPGTDLSDNAPAGHRELSFHYEGPEADLVRRAAITLKLCDHWSNGSLVAAPTSSLPAPIGGVRNWDYRYTWIRDASFSVYALRRIGFENEAEAFLGWVLDTFEHGSAPKIMYDVEGGAVPDERIDAELEGYRRSAPARWGNGAADQRQHDVYGEILDCAYQWARHGGRIEQHLWSRLTSLADLAVDAWRLPDQGIWEVRSEGRVFTYSAGLCQVALDRAARIAEEAGLRASAKWREAAQELRSIVLEQAWDEDAETLTEHIDGGGGLDASLLALPLRRVVPAEHPRMVATTAAVAERLSAGGGLLYRYLHDASPDGIAGDEGAFLLCSFWLVENLARQGKQDEAGELYASLCARASSLGLLPEQIDPSSGEFCGNFPQAFSHIGVIAAGVRLARAFAEREAGGSRM